MPTPTTVSYTYNDRGNRSSMTDEHGTTTYTYDERDRLLSKATPIGTLSYTYDLHGNLLTIKSSNVNGTDLTYEFDALNRLRNTINPTTGLTQYNYDNVGNLRSFIYPNGVNTFYDYDHLNRLTNMAINRLTTPMESYAYRLSVTGHRLGVQEGNGRNVSYEYDDLYRLTKETILGASILGNIDYSLDPVGNRLNMNSSVLGIPSQVNTFDGNDLLGSDTSDANGNTTAADGRTFTYDFENRIRSVSSAPSAVNILYDGDGNRVKKTVNGIETYYLVDTVNLTGYAQVMEELTIHDTQPTVSRVFTYGLDLISQERLHDTPTGAIWQARFYGYDGHGNVRFLTDPDGHITDRYDFDAYGNLLAQSGTTANNYLYCGEQFDPDVGLYFLRARYMDTERGRFWTMDVFEGRNFDPASLQKFLYANSAPINYIDPTGQFSLIQVMFTATLIGFLAGCTRPETVKVNTSVIIWEYEPSSDSGAHSAHTWVEWTDKNGNRRSAGFNHPAAPHPKMYISDDPSENDPYAYPFGPYYKVKQIVISSTKYDIEAFIECLDNKAANPPASPQHEHCVDYATKLVDGCLAVSRKR